MEYTKKLKVGEGFEPGVFLGPIQNEMQYERVKGFLSDIKENKLTLAAGGESVTSNTTKGYFIDPVVVDNPSDDSRIVTEEPFGEPVIQRYRTRLLTRSRPYCTTDQVARGGRGAPTRQCDADGPGSLGLDERHGSSVSNGTQDRCRKRVGKYAYGTAAHGRVRRT